MNTKSVIFTSGGTTSENTTFECNKDRSYTEKVKFSGGFCAPKLQMYIFLKPSGQGNNIFSKPFGVKFNDSSMFLLGMILVVSVVSIENKLKLFWLADL